MTRGYLAAVVAAVLWGLGYALSQRLVETLSPARLMLMGSFWAVAFALPVGLAERGPWPSLDRTFWLYFVGMELACFLANFIMLIAVQHLGATRAVIFEIAYPLFTALFCISLFGQTPSARLIIGGLLIFSGALLVATDDEPAPPGIEEQPE